MPHLYSTRCWLDNQLQPATISFDNGIITHIYQGKLNNPNVVDVGDDVLMPGCIDVHAHINEPGRTDWEGFDTATQAAAAGGITTVIDMPLNSSPVTTTVAAFEQKLAASKGKMHVNCGFYGGLVPDNLQHLTALVDAGVLGIKAFLVHSGIDEFPNVGRKELDAAMAILAPYNVPLLAHCENPPLAPPKGGEYCQENAPPLGGEHSSTEANASDDEANASPPFPKGGQGGDLSYAQYLASRPKQWENDAVLLMIDLCRKHACKTHIVHLSSAEALPYIAQAKQEGLPLTVETCPHYLLFSAETIPDGNTLYKCAPPIREAHNNNLIKQAFGSGLMDFVSSDHSPAPPAIKEIESGNLQKAWGGIAGLQFLLPASYTSLKEYVSLAQFIPLITQKPAQFLGVDTKKGSIKVGYDADFTIWKPEASFVPTPQDVLHRYPISPYIGQRLFGVVQQTYVNGVLVFNHHQIINKNAGQWLLRK